MYIVLEMQTNGETTSLLSNTYTDKNVAESKYHTILAAASTSDVEIHSAAIMDEYGILLRSEYYKHEGEEDEISTQ